VKYCVHGMWVLMLVLSGCVTTPEAERPRIAEQPVSQQTETVDARQRAKIHTELGALYFQQERYAVALEEARIALNIESSYAPAYNLLGLVNMMLVDNPAAESAFQSALGYAPNDPEINNNYGWFLCNSGKEADSLRYFENAYRNALYRTPTRPYTNAGICLIKLKNYKVAEERLITALRFDPSNTLAMYWLAELMYRTDRLVEARARVNEMTRILEPTAEVLWLGVRVEHKLGDREAELRHSTVLRRRFQNTVEYQKLIQGQFE
jgi:type IV pilus assembly protein PilF